MYTYTELDNGEWQLLVDTSPGSIIFNLSLDPERGLPEHVQMIQDFQDSSKLEYFVSLLVQDPQTAFIKYNYPELGS